MTHSKDSELRQIARLRLARVLIDQGKPDDAIKTLANPCRRRASASRARSTRRRLLRQEGHPAALAEYQAGMLGAEMPAASIPRCCN
jgi:predicted negative regulator of RcsB-dependent stress response